MRVRLPALTPDPSTPPAARHDASFAVRPPAAGGLGLRFAPDPAGGVAAEFACAPDYQGYADRLHGGIIATLLDAAMTHCLRAEGVTGYTGKLQVRFRAPVRLGVTAQVRGWRVESRGSLHLLRAELRQEGAVRATAEGTFWSPPG